MRTAIPVAVLFALLSLHILTVPVLSERRKMLPKGEEASYVLPAPLLKITALEFDSLASDFTFLQAMVFMGSTFERKERPRVKEWEWRWLHDTLNASTDLDPYFLDPYYFGEANLTWEGNMIREANKLLEKGSKYRDWDWMLPFFIGFNHFYFLQENDRASEYLMEASKRPDASPMFASLATRLAYKGNRTENAIIFLRQLLKDTTDERLKKEYETRLTALEKILFLEKAVTVYNERFEKAPSKLDDLVTAGIIRTVPEDPYGGKFYIDTEGSIKTTSDLRPMK